MVHLNTNNTNNNTYIRDANTQGTHEIERILVTNNTKKNFYILGFNSTQFFIFCDTPGKGMHAARARQGPPRPVASVPVKFGLNS